MSGRPTSTTQEGVVPASQPERSNTQESPTNTAASQQRTPQAKSDAPKPVSGAPPPQQEFTFGSFSPASSNVPTSQPPQPGTNVQIVQPVAQRLNLPARTSSAPPDNSQQALHMPSFVPTHHQHPHMYPPYRPMPPHMGMGRGMPMMAPPSGHPMHPHAAPFMPPQGVPQQVPQQQQPQQQPQQKQQSTSGSISKMLKFVHAPEFTPVKQTQTSVPATPAPAAPPVAAPPAATTPTTTAAHPKFNANAPAYMAGGMAVTAALSTITSSATPATPSAPPSAAVTPAPAATAPVSTPSATVTSTPSTPTVTATTAPTPAAPTTPAPAPAKPVISYAATVAKPAPAVTTPTKDTRTSSAPTTDVKAAPVKPAEKAAQPEVKPTQGKTEPKVDPKPVETPKPVAQEKAPEVKPAEKKPAQPTAPATPTAAEIVAGRGKAPAPVVKPSAAPVSRKKALEEKIAKRDAMQHTDADDYIIKPKEEPKPVEQPPAVQAPAPAAAAAPAAEAAQASETPKSPSQDVPDSWESAAIEDVANRPVKEEKKPQPSLPSFDFATKFSGRAPVTPPTTPGSGTGVSFPEQDLSRRIYSIDFLRGFQEKCMDKPADMPMLEGVAPIPLDSGRRGSRVSGRPDRFQSAGSEGMRAGRQGTPTGRRERGERGPRDRRQGGRKPPQAPTETLAPSATGYKVSVAKDELEALRRRVQALLNKLTPEKFETIFQQLLEIPLETPDKLREMINLVFGKAVDEQAFSSMYAQLCERLEDKLPKFEDTSLPPDSKAREISFRRILLSKCQHMFENKPEAESELKEKLAQMSEADREEYEYRLRQTTLGNVKFIGELFKRKMLTERIMHACIQQMLTVDVSEESLEALSKLITTVGMQLDSPQSKYRGQVDTYFAEIKKLSKNKQFSSRIRFMLLDVIELREKQRWQPRRDEKGPKKLSEIKDEQARDPAQKSAPGAPPPRVAPPSRRGAPPTNLPTTRTPIPPQFLRQPSGAQSRGVKEGDDGFITPSARQEQTARPGRRPGQEEKKGEPVRHINRFGALADSGDSPAKQAYSPVRIATKPAPAAVAEPPKQMNASQAESSAEQLIQEYIQTGLQDEAIRCTEEIVPVDLRSKVVEMGVNVTSEMKDEDREKFATLLVILGKKKLLSPKNYAEGFAPCLEAAPDIIIDVPKFLEYLALFLARTVLEDCLTLDVIQPSLEELIPSGLALKLVLATFRKIIELSDSHIGRRIFEDSGIDLRELLTKDKSSEHLLEVLHENGLEALMPLLKVERYLDKAFAEEKPAAEILEWLSKHAHTAHTDSGLSRVLMREVLQVAGKLLDKGTEAVAAIQHMLKQYGSVLKSYSKGRAAQVSLIVECQNFCAQRGFPKGVMEQLFYQLYDALIATEDAFLEWKDDITETSKAKQDALVQTNRFFTWLQTAEEESTSEEADEDDEDDTDAAGRQDDDDVEDDDDDDAEGESASGSDD